MVMKVACIGILIWVGPVHSDVIGEDAEASLVKRGAKVINLAEDCPIFFKHGLD